MFEDIGYEVGRELRSIYFRRSCFGKGVDLGGSIGIYYSSWWLRGVGLRNYYNFRVSTAASNIINIGYGLGG